MRSGRGRRCRAREVEALKGVVKAAKSARGRRGGGFGALHAAKRGLAVVCRGLLWGWRGFGGVEGQNGLLEVRARGSPGHGTQATEGLRGRRSTGRSFWGPAEKVEPAEELRGSLLFGRRGSTWGGSVIGGAWPRWGRRVVIFAAADKVKVLGLSGRRRCGRN